MNEKRLVVLGSGESGLGAAKLARQKGWEVLVSDSGIIDQERREVLSSIGALWEEGGHSDQILEASEWVKSPGIPDEISIVNKAVEKGISVISEIEFAFRYTDATIVGVTGSNGKTTTVSLLQHIMERSGRHSVLAGNVGRSFASAVCDEDPEIYVLELSSFQLDGIKDFRPDIAILLNITPDHLDRYGGSMDRYTDSKFRITMNQTSSDVLIHNLDDPFTQQGLERNGTQALSLPFSIEQILEVGAWIQEEAIHINTKSKLNTTMSIYKLALQGKHNLYNSMAAGMAARVLDVRSELLRESLSDFKNIEHRLEWLGRVNGVEYINDSKATNVNATYFALESMENPVVWIAGGVDKGNDYKLIQELVGSKVKTIICLGTDNKKLIKAFKKIVPEVIETSSMQEAVKLASIIAKKGDTVLLSPCCASFDLFKNYEERGRMFKREVRSL